MVAYAKRRTRRIALVAFVGAAAGLARDGELPLYETLIRNARIVDGSGGAWYRADIGVSRGRIARIGRLTGARARRVIDAQDRVAAPGFIDVHTHVERELPARPDAVNLVADGVTSIVTGNCGGSALPIGEWFGGLARAGTAVNVASLVGHNSIRQAVLGIQDRPPKPRELAEMEMLVARAMEEGAAGFSTGLIYIPGTFAETPELVALARAAARSGGIYATHMRSENVKLFEAIEEALAIARAAAIPLEISHFKVSSKKLWGESPRMIERVERARAQGIDVTLDVYPYAASSTGLDTLLPDWALSGKGGSPAEALAGRLAKKREREKIAQAMYRRLHDELGRDHLDYAIVARARWDQSLEGKSLREINLARQTNGGSSGRGDTLEAEIETVLDLCERGREEGQTARACGVQMVYHSMDEGDVERILAHPLTMVARDGGVPEFGAGRPHPRSYGTASRVLARYVRERKVIRLEEAVRKLTSLPAQRFGFQDRGLLREGFWADIVLFEPESVADLSTFEDPHRYSQGFDDVLVNGALVREGGKPTRARPGRILYGGGLDRDRLTHRLTLSSAGRGLRLFSSGGRESRR